MDEAAKAQLRQMLEEGASPDDVRKRLAKLQTKRTSVDDYVESEAKKMMNELLKRWEVYSGRGYLSFSFHVFFFLSEKKVFLCL